MIGPSTSHAGVTHVVKRILTPIPVAGGVAWAVLTMPVTSSAFAPRERLRASWA